MDNRSHGRCDFGSAGSDIAAVLGGAQTRDALRSHIANAAELLFLTVSTVGNVHGPSTFSNCRAELLSRQH